jgi:hypothetical protein
LASDSSFGVLSDISAGRQPVRHRLDPRDMGVERRLQAQRTCTSTRWAMLLPMPRAVQTLTVDAALIVRRAAYEFVGA